MRQARLSVMTAAWLMRLKHFYAEFTSINQMRDFMSAGGKKTVGPFGKRLWDEMEVDLFFLFFCFFLFVCFFFYLQTNFLGGELNHEYVPLSISIKTDTIHFPPPRADYPS